MRTERKKVTVEDAKKIRASISTVEKELRPFLPGNWFDQGPDKSTPFELEQDKIISNSYEAIRALRVYVEKKILDEEYNW